MLSPAFIHLSWYQAEIDGIMADWWPNQTLNLGKCLNTLLNATFCHRAQFICWSPNFISLIRVWFQDKLVKNIARLQNAALQTSHQLSMRFFFFFLLLLNISLLLQNTRKYECKKKMYQLLYKAAFSEYLKEKAEKSKLEQLSYNTHCAHRWNST